MVAVALICCNKGLNTKIRQSTIRGTINLLQKIKQSFGNLSYKKIYPYISFC